MNFKELEVLVEKRIVEILEDFELELFEFNLKNLNGTITISALIDKARGGITLEKCSTVNKKISEDSQINDLIKDGYIVEVASPGIDRPMKSEKDFNRVRGCEIDVYLKEVVSGRLQHSGRLLEARNEEILIEIGDDTISLPLAKINKAVQKI